MDTKTPALNAIVRLGLRWNAIDPAIAPTTRPTAKTGQK
jgi:hypothetical protein